MPLTLADMVAQVRGHLDQYTTNRAATATFEGWTPDAPAAPTGLKLADVSSGDKLLNTVVELASGELVHIGTYDPTSHRATCPPWFRGQLGTPQDDTVATGTRAVVEPLWPTFHIAQKICDGIQNLYPDLFQVKEVQLSSSAINGNYLMPDDAEDVLHLTIENVGPGVEQFKIWAWSMDVSNIDGLRYLRTRTSSLAGRPLYVTYRAKAIVPAPGDLATTWESTGLPDSAADLPVLYAVYTMLPAVESAKTQMHSMEQSDRNRFVQAGSANAASRRFQEMFERRLLAERRKLLDRFAPRTHKNWNG
jgi:hypothetical protein